MKRDIKNTRNSLGYLRDANVQAIGGSRALGKREPEVRAVKGAVTGRTHNQETMGDATKGGGGDT